MTLSMRCIVTMAAACVAGCAQPGSGTDRWQSPKPHLFEGMGAHHRTITTSSPQAQQYFDQGLIWVFAFNHEEAMRSFTETARLDPDCAMAWWGIALANGPHINRPEMDAKHSSAAWEAIKAARQRAAGAAPVEQALIEALARRYAETPSQNRKPLDEAYASAMRDVWKAYPSDVDVGTLFAEAMMDLRPWDLWMKDGQPQPGTEEIVATLESVLRNAPNHPGALHLYIHAVEGSPTPERALAAADRLCNLVPASGHLMHMPSHIYARTGHWQEAVAANVRAVAADANYRALRLRPGFYRGYMAHNAHFLAYAAMMRGQSELAIRAARDVVHGIPEEFSREYPDVADALLCVPYDSLKRFGRWDAILSEPEPDARFPFTQTMWRCTRGIAYAAKGELAAAKREQAAFRSAAARVKPDAPIGNSKAGAVLAVAEHLLEGEICFAEGKLDAAITALRAAVAAEDELPYDEPPDWIQPARHTLGAVLVSARQYDEAEKVYREDLQKVKNNGWSLYGLAECLRQKGDTKGAEEVTIQFKAAWADADTPIGASCLCAQRGKQQDR